jgi:hypothetical protein
MNFTPATMDREDSYRASQSGRGRGRHARPANENSDGRGRPVRPSRTRRYLIGAGVAVVGGAAVVVGLMTASSPVTHSVQPAATTQTGGSGSHTANPAVPSRPNANPAVPSRPNANPAVPSQPGAQTANPAGPATPGAAS